MRIPGIAIVERDDAIRERLENMENAIVFHPFDVIC
jgi:hypothetical protein